MYGGRASSVLDQGLPKGGHYSSPDRSAVYHAGHTAAVASIAVSATAAPASPVIW
jgi:hypothetical protein